MAVYIAHAAADVGVAKSLARFLKGQSLPVRLIGVDRLPMAAKQADNMILLWSRDMAFRFGTMRNRIEAATPERQMIIVDIDGAVAAPTQISTIDARSKGLRQGRTWRTVTALAKKRPTAMQDTEVVVTSAAPLAKSNKTLSNNDEAAPKTQYLSAYGFGLILLIAMIAALAWLAPDISSQIRAG